MNIQDQVCVFEQAKKLKELGVGQESLFYWRGETVWHINEVTDWPNQEQLSNLIASGDEKDIIFSAFTVGELMMMLPDYESIHSSMDKRTWYAGSVENDDDYIFGNNIGDAAAKRLISLIESGIITVGGINNRLTNT